MHFDRGSFMRIVGWIAKGVGLTAVLMASFAMADGGSATCSTSGGATISSDASATGLPSSKPAVPEDIQPFGYAADPTPALTDTGDFLYPVPDRWRIGIPAGYRQNETGSIYDPYHQNVLKGDYALPGTQDLFFMLTATSDTLAEGRKLPTPSGLSSLREGSFKFFGSGNQVLLNQDVLVTLDFFEGDAGYKQKDFEVRATLDGNANFLHAAELGVVSPDPGEGHDRIDGIAAPQELFVEKRIVDLSPNFDFISIRAGYQEFNSDFRGLLFNDEEPGVRLFGTLDNNIFQYNLAWFHTVEKNTDSGLNSFRFRGQDVYIANLYWQDFFFPGYTAQFSAQANIDRGGTQYDSNGFLVRPQPIGSIANKEVHAYYFGWAGDGHIGRFNISHQFYQALGDESFNPLADQRVHINAQLAAVELSYDEDYIRYRTSFIYASGDNDPTDGKATGFDSIFDNPNFAGGATNFFTRQAIPLGAAGVNLTNRNSFLPDLRTSKEEGQASFVNPGLLLYNVGVDVDILPDLTLVTNASYLQFVSPDSLRLLLFDNKIGRDIGVDLSASLVYRPLLNQNIIMQFGAAALVPGQAFKELYSNQVLYSVFTSITLTF